MNMPKISIAIGLLLGVVGIAGAVHASTENKSFVTALIPLYLGIVFGALGVASLVMPTMRKHFMHALAALALLGVLMAAGRLAMTWNRPGVSGVARGSQVAMAVLCGATVGLCVKSFRDARRAREAALIV